MELWLIRHGMTKGNQEKRYIGKTDERLSEEGIRRLQKVSYPVPQLLFSSPMKRCLETAQILFPGVKAEIVRDLREMDFGIFENRNAQEMEQDPSYRLWIESFCEAEIPMGEKKCSFQKRTLQAFDQCMDICGKSGIQTAAIIAHGGTLMSVLDAYGEEEKAYYEWSVENGCGYQTEWNFEKKEEKKRCLQVIRKVFLEK